MAEVFSIYQFLFFIVIYLSSSSLSLETDTITSAAPLRDPDTIISPQKLFKFGFFTPAGAGTSRRYAGVFYTASESTIAWVANRENPLPDSSGAAAISPDGNLVLLDSSNRTVWSTNATTSAATSLKILDTGNLVLLDAATGATLWESFSHPCNVLLPTMKIGDNVKTKKRVVLTSWKTADDPSVGSFSLGIDARGIPQQFMRRNSNENNDENGVLVWRSGPWNGIIYLGIQDMFRYYVKGFSVLTNDTASGDFVYTIPPQKIPMHSYLNSSGNVARAIWDEGLRSWKKVWSAPEKVCDHYGKCGPYGICDDRASPVCSCLRGFEPSSGEAWRRGNWSGGCTRRKPLQCDGNGESGDGFWREKFVKVPDFPEAVSGVEEEECRGRCLRNCSCFGYAYDANIGCMFWGDHLIDVERFDGVGVDLFVRLSSSELGMAFHRSLRHLCTLLSFLRSDLYCISLFIRRKGQEAVYHNSGRGVCFCVGFRLRCLALDVEEKR